MKYPCSRARLVISNSDSNRKFYCILAYLINWVTLAKYCTFFFPDHVNKYFFLKLEVQSHWHKFITLRGHQINIFVVKFGFQMAVGRYKK